MKSRINNVADKGPDCNSYIISFDILTAFFLLAITVEIVLLIIPDKMIPLERQLTSPSDQLFTRQPTSPFDLQVDNVVPSVLGNKIKALGDKKAEFEDDRLRLVYNASDDATSLFVAGGGNDNIRIGERIEVTNWAQNSGLLICYNGKPCVAVGSLANTVPTDPKALQSAQRFANAAAAATGGAFGQLLVSLAKAADGSALANWRAQAIAQSILAPELSLAYPFC